MKKKKPCFLVLESYWSENLRERESVQPFVKGLTRAGGGEGNGRQCHSSDDSETIDIHLNLGGTVLRLICPLVCPGSLVTLFPHFSRHPGHHPLEVADVPDRGYQ